MGLKQMHTSCRKQISIQCIHIHLSFNTVLLKALCVKVFDPQICMNNLASLSFKLISVQKVNFAESGVSIN